MPTQTQSIVQQHATWLSLMEISGPFLSTPVLEESFPHGLDKREDESEVRRRVSLAYEEWLNNQSGTRPDPAIHQQWLRFVLEEVLEIAPQALLSGQEIPATLRSVLPEYHETLHPQLVVRSPYEPEPRLLVQLYPRTQDLNKVVAEQRWKASPATRMAELLRHSGTRLGLVTNGRHWMLVDAPRDETTGYYTWDATLWTEEELTLRAFRTLLGMERFFTVPDAERLEALLAKSAQKQEEVTSQLGDQVRRAVETLVLTLDRLDKDSQRALLENIAEKELYEAALTVMMRLVFLLSAEEREMLLLGEPLYEESYAISTIHKQLQEQADQQGEEVLGLRYDAWSRLLAAFRVVYGGVEHVRLRLPAYGGDLFNPDRYPFLEGRKVGTSWRETPAEPLLIDNRTVLHLLRALQFLHVKIGGLTEARRLSFRALDIEQIGHVYEGLLDHTARRSHQTILGLLGSKDGEPEATLDELEEARNKGERALIKLLMETSGRGESSVQKNLAQGLDTPLERSRLMEACDNNQALFERVLPFAGLLRKDAFGNFLLVTPGSIYVTHGTDRRSTGTHYTPRSLTEPLVQHALDPLVYLGPAEGLPREEWQLRDASEILDLKICDLAMGSGAFLVQACRYLSEKLVESWDAIERAAMNGNSRDIDEHLATARRIVAERCLYGVDKNPMAVEMAKLSLWLITLAKNKPFTFLDSNLRCGDSLLSVNLQQLQTLAMDAKDVRQMSFMGQAMERAITLTLNKRREISMRLEQSAVDTDEKAHKLSSANDAMQLLKLGGDLLIALALAEPKRRADLRNSLLYDYELLITAAEDARVHPLAAEKLREHQQNVEKLRATTNNLLRNHTPFHWPLEFPEVFAGKGDEAGFAAVVGNPPFQGGKKITGVLGTGYRDYMVKYLAKNKSGSADLCAYFFLRAAALTRRNGVNALLATNTIAQGDTREVALDELTTANWTIIRAIPSRKWSGEANLEVAYVWLWHGSWSGKIILNDLEVEGITPFLTIAGRAQGNPYKLEANQNEAFIGSVISGIGFVVSPEEAQLLMLKEKKNAEVLFLYLNADDVNSRPDQSPSRWVINFRDWPLEQAEFYPHCMQIVREKVKPQRDNLNRKVYRERWWQYAEKCLTLYDTLKDLNTAWVIPRVSKYLICAQEPIDIVFSDATVVIASESKAYFALLQSTFHENWSRINGSSMRTDLRYTPTDCFQTFSFPPNMEQIENIGERYYTHRQSIMLARQEGLTSTYNRFHNPAEHASDSEQLRKLHKEMDEAVARAYGWEDLRLEHGFYETKQGLRYTISEAARREVLDRLLLLNHERHAEEVAAGLVDESGKPPKGKAKGANGTQKEVEKKERRPGSGKRVAADGEGLWGQARHLCI